MTVKVIREVLWWLITALVVIAVLYPIHTAIHYKFAISNAFLIIVALTYFRYVVFFNDVVILKNKWVRAVIFIANIYLFIFIFTKIQDFNAIFDTFKISEFANHLKRELSIYEEGQLLRYIYREVIFSLIASMMMVVALNFRLLLSYFLRKKKRLEPVS